MCSRLVHHLQELEQFLPSNENLTFLFVFSETGVTELDFFMRGYLWDDSGLGISGWLCLLVRATVVVA